MFSVIIPTYNNLDYLKLCLKSLSKNSNLNNEIIVHINDGSDGTIEFINENKIKHTYSRLNEGVCVAFNEGAKIAKKEYIVLGHDDMYFCPNWDVLFEKEIKHFGKKDFFISGTMVQHFNGLINLDCGHNPETFNESKLLKELPKIIFNDFQGTHWQPSLISKSLWDQVGGFSEEFSPGLGSDPDFSMKLWHNGVRIFKGLGNCRVYHFSSVSLRKKAWNNGAKTFLLKWGISIKFFKKYYLRSAEVYEGPLKEPLKSYRYYFDLLITKLKYIYAFVLLKLLNE